MGTAAGEQGWCGGKCQLLDIQIHKRDQCSGFYCLCTVMTASETGRRVKAGDALPPACCLMEHSARRTQCRAFEGASAECFNNRHMFSFAAVKTVTLSLVFCAGQPPCD